MATKTNAIRRIESAGVVHEVRRYEIAMKEFSATAVAALIGMDPAQVFKTLVAAEADVTVFAVVASDAELDLKALARAAEVRRLELVAVQRLERLTGYRRGGVTALGAKRAFPVFLDATALDHEWIGVSAGRKGLQVVLAPEDYIALTDATVVELQR